MHRCRDRFVSSTSSDRFARVRGILLGARSFARARASTGLRASAAVLSACALAAALPPAPPAAAAPLPILVDGDYGDWDGVAPAWQDPNGDGGPSGIDVGRIWVSDDPDFLFLRFEVGPELDLDEGNSFVLYLDTDANSATGLQIGGIGAELEWRLGDRRGTWRYAGGSQTVYQDDLSFIAMPTVTAGEFEASFDRAARPDGTHPLFLSSTVRIVFRDTGSGGDQAPDGTQILGYTFDQGTVPEDIPLELARADDGDLRIGSWNVHDDSPWDGSLQAGFRREFQAVVPDILSLEEIYNHTPAQTAALIESWLPSGPGEAWHYSGNNDCHVISRYPVLGSWPLDGNLAVLLDTGAKLGSPLLLVSAHLPCCTNDAGRQQEVDRILGFIRDAKAPGGPLTLEEGTPIVITGDMNFVGLSAQLRSLRTGDIADNGTFGPDFAPDWDGSELTDLISRHTDLRAAYTWRNDNGSYWPGRLDFMIYSDSVISEGNHYLLYTPDMPADRLTAYGLQSGDSDSSDHLLYCADFRPTTTGVAEGDSVEQGEDEPRTALRWSVGPNPSRGAVTFSFEAAGTATVRLGVLDPRGRLRARPLGDGITLQGHLERAWNWTDDSGRSLPSGIYLLRLSGTAEGRAFRTVRRVVRIR